MVVVTIDICMLKVYSITLNIGVHLFTWVAYFGFNSV